jgi:sterol desaturase/sphingolipid hydroxylase (fatty acid hydroxylase superfamily)
MNLPPILVEVLRTGLWLAILVAIFTPLERFLAVCPHKLWRKGMGTDLDYYFLNSLLVATLLGMPVALLATLGRWVLPAGVHATLGSWPFAVRAALAFVAGEVGYYWGHRLCHEVPLLWRFHTIHHSAEEMDFLVSSRAHPLDVVFGRLCALAPMHVLGLAGPTGATGGTSVAVTVSVLAMLWGFFIHSNVRVRLGVLERVISTPMFHHWHHTKSGPINKNYSSNFPWLDALFGSLHLPGTWPEDYGIKEAMPDVLVDQLVHPLFPTPAQAQAEPGAAP